jgi:hypothetical protein
MTMGTETTWDLPPPEPQKNLADKVLQEVVSRLDARYAKHGIEALPTQTVRRDPEQGMLVVYALYLSATWDNDASYRVFEMTSRQSSGGLPVEVEAFSESPVSYGMVNSEERLHQIITEILDDTRTRWFINTYLHALANSEQLGGHKGYKYTPMAKGKAAGKTAAAKKAAAPTGLSAALVLHHYLLRLFGVEDLKALSKDLKESHLEGYDTDNVSHYFHALRNWLPAGGELTEDRLKQYDANIYRHTQAIGQQRPVKWKYFQYLALLFTEIYLDEYFSNPAGLLDQLNQHRQTAPTKHRNFTSLSPYTRESLNKLALWNATGSGKTLLMHVNILQYQHYLARQRKGKELNRILVLTPNEGLSKQHLREFQESGLPAALFDKNAPPLFQGANHGIEIIDLYKLEETSGPGTVAIEAFEGNNLVLVDEAHRGGQDSKKIRPMRNRLTQGGFSFEYSATFGQAVNAQQGANRAKFLDEYGKVTLFDYSYRYFYDDGYGKDYRILNMNQGWETSGAHRSPELELYLTALLLSFYEQLLVFEENRPAIEPYLVARPLAVFVGGKVSADGVKSASDIVPLLQFMHRFVHEPAGATSRLRQLLRQETALLDGSGRPVFGPEVFSYVRRRYDATVQGEGAYGAVYLDVLRRVFNTEAAGASLHLENLKGQDGEIGLRVGTSPEYFGVINVGEDAKLLKLCAEKGLLTEDKSFSKSLFQGLNNTDSRVNMLIGAKKFTEGWSSWRVSTMGLLNVGKGEGSEIIQLFGRGVRLKGYDFSLKRSTRLDTSQRPAKVPKEIAVLETLNIFGLQAKYMDEFRDRLADEGMSTGKTEQVVLALHPRLPAAELAGKGLKYVRVKAKNNFKKAVQVLLQAEHLPSKVQLDRRTHIQKVQSIELRQQGAAAADPTVQLEARHLAFVDWDQVYLELAQLKNERGWHNLLLTRDQLQTLLTDHRWYELRLQPGVLDFSNLGDKLPVWQELATSLLKGYCEKLYDLHKGRYYGQHLEVALLEASHPNMLTEYTVTVDSQEEEILQRLQDLQQRLAAGPLAASETIVGGLEALVSQLHLYNPLLSLRGWKSDQVQVQPVPLNKGEEEFINDLRKCHERTPKFFADKEVYLLRNMSRRGVGFFEANNFYPDFILWLVVGAKQYVLFIDPKGLRQVQGFTDPKVALYRKLRDEIEPTLGDANLRLTSFIVSDTPYYDLRHWSGQAGVADFAQQHVYLREGQSDYVLPMLEAALH